MAELVKGPKATIDMKTNEIQTIKLTMVNTGLQGWGEDTAIA
jgi:hypothetical protein